MNITQQIPVCSLIDHLANLSLDADSAEQTPKVQHHLPDLVMTNANPSSDLLSMLKVVFISIGILLFVNPAPHRQLLDPTVHCPQTS